MPTQSPSQTIGPFFSFGLFRGGESNLVANGPQGDYILLTGRVLDGDGQPVTDAMVEIWQADANGHFNHPADPYHASADPKFPGFGRSQTVDNGRFMFKTVVPGLVSDSKGGIQAPHFNVRVFARGMLIHAVTRFYFADELLNKSDAVLRSVPAGRRHTLLLKQLATSDLTTFELDIHLQGANETVFFDL